MCAGAQQQFWAYHDRLFGAVPKWATSEAPTPVFAALARELKSWDSWGTRR